jgi:hypothetical protein
MPGPRITSAQRALEVAATGRSKMMSDSPTVDVGFHERRHAARMQDPEYREAYERAAREIAQTDAVIREPGQSKAE